MNCELIFYLSSKTNLCERALRSSIEGLDLRFSSARFSTSPESLGTLIIDAFEVLNVVENNKEIAEEEEIESTEASTEAISGPSGPVVTGPVVTGPVTAVEEETDEGQIFQVVEQMPEFPGGMEALMKYLQKNIKYPSRAQDNNVQGRVMVTFVVNKDGSIVDPEVIKAVDKDLDNEALRVVKGMPKWNPGKQRGKPVRVKYTVPVTFRLQ